MIAGVCSPCPLREKQNDMDTPIFRTPSRLIHSVGAASALENLFSTCSKQVDENGSIRTLLATLPGTIMVSENCVRNCAVCTTSRTSSKVALQKGETAGAASPIFRLRLGQTCPHIFLEWKCSPAHAEHRVQAAQQSAHRTPCSACWKPSKTASCSRAVAAPTHQPAHRAARARHHANLRATAGRIRTATILRLQSW